jgi:hypothetical protein
MAYPETARHLNGLAEELLRGRSSLTPGEREVIATFVSSYTYPVKMSGA